MPPIARNPNVPLPNPDDPIVTRSNTGRLIPPRVRQQQERFLAEYSTSAALLKSCRAAGINQARHHEWMNNDPTYPSRFQEAYELACESLAVEARRRAVDGVEVPVGFYQGTPGAYVRKYSDTLLMFLLRAAKPEIYRDRIDISGPNGGPIQVEDISASLELLPVQLKRLMVAVLEGDEIDLVALEQVTITRVKPRPDNDIEIDSQHYEVRDDGEVVAVSDVVSSTPLLDSGYHVCEMAIFDADDDYDGDFEDYDFDDC